MCAYSVATAEKEHERILGFRELTSSSFSVKECSLFLRLLHQHKKDWVTISRAMKRTRSEVMVHYYKWKGKEAKMNEENNVYGNLKLGWKSDYCYICDDGGQLIICDGCHRAVHPRCLSPPLKSVPKGDWFCPRCTFSPVKPVRDGPRQRCSAGNYARTPTAVCRPRSPASTTPVQGVSEAPIAKRVLLDGFSECCRPATPSTPMRSVSKVLDVETPGSASVGSLYSPGGD
jgi:PHD-finger